MSVDLGTQIRDYARAVNVEQDPVNLDEIVERRFSTGPVQIIGPVASSVESRQRRRWPVAVAVAAVVALVGGSALLFRVTEPDTPVITQPDLVPTTLPEATPTTVSTIPDPLSSSGWTRIPDDEAVFGGAGRQEMGSVTVGGPGLVAVGSDGRDAAVWISLDGIDWLRVPHDEEVFGGPNNPQMLSVIAGGPGLVAVGSVGLNDDGDAAVWTSIDGITWSRIPHDESVFGGPNTQRMLSVIVGGPGLVAVGTEGGVAEEDWDAAVWTSVDGITWSRVPHDEAVFGGAESQAMASVTVGGPGLVAVGGPDLVEVGGPGHVCETCEGYAAVWTSVDGITWSRVPHDEAVFGGGRGATMRSVTAGGPGLVAVGTASPIPTEAGGDEEKVAAVWTSVDGIAWSRVPHDRTVLGGRGTQVMFDVTVGGPGLVAVGSSQIGDGEFSTHEAPDAAVWTSVDGITWSWVPNFEGRWMSSVTVAGPGLVAVGGGFLSDPEDVDAVVWTGMAED